MHKAENADPPLDEADGVTPSKGAVDLDVLRSAAMAKPYRKSFLSLFLPRIGGAPPRQPTTPSTPKFQAVSIQRGARFCEVARRLGDRRFLARNSPALPLPGCSMGNQCQCRYLKHPDRRVEARRLMDLGLSTLMFDAKERRSRKGRRSTD